MRVSHSAVFGRIQRTLRYFENLRKMSCITPSEYTILVQKEHAEDFCSKCMQKVGVPSNQSDSLAKVLIAGDYRGHYSHGLNRLEMYVQDIEKGVCDVKSSPTVEKETVSTALVNGNNLLGPVVGNFAMNMAIEKAKSTGIGWVAVKGSNHFGIAGWYTILAAKEGVIGLSFTNTSPLVFPTRAKGVALGTNPISVAAPSCKPGDEFVLDMATSAVALGKLEMCKRRGLSIPEGWAADSSGKSTTDPAAGISNGGLMPLGGDEHSSGYKGYGLAMVVEMFCGILANAAYGPNIRRWMNTERPANLGQCFAAIDPKAFGLGFDERMADYMETMRNMPRVDENVPVLVPGDPERKHIEECEKYGGILYPQVLVDSMNKLADRLGVSRMPARQKM